MTKLHRNNTFGIEDYMQPILSPAERERRQRLRDRVIKPLAAAAVAGVAFGLVGPHAYEQFRGPQYSDTTREYVAKPGEGITAAAKDVKGVEKYSINDTIIYIEELPANQEVLADGLQVGETLVIPDSVE